MAFPKIEMPPLDHPVSVFAISGAVAIAVMFGLDFAGDKGVDFGYFTREPSGSAAALFWILTAVIGAGGAVAAKLKSKH